jgi:hypothetical protein
MHITQTYMGKYGDSGLFVYYLFEDYVLDQKTLTERVQHALDDLGADYLDDVDLFRPNERYAGDIAAEVRKIEPVWRYCRTKLPGFLVSYKPLAKVDPTDDTVLFFSIKDRDEGEALQAVEKIRAIVVDQIRRPPVASVEVESGYGFVARVFEALEIKPGFFGVSIDLKRLVRRRQ